MSTSILSNANVSNYHSVRFGGVSGVTIAVGELHGKVVAFWSPKGAGLSQVVHTFGSASEAEKLPTLFRASTGLEISVKSLQKLMGQHMSVLSAAPAPTATKASK
jgi:hypothetical protein